MAPHGAVRCAQKEPVVLKKKFERALYSYQYGYKRVHKSNEGGYLTGSFNADGGMLCKLLNNLI